MENSGEEHILQDRILLTGNFYLGYFILNILVLWLALFLFERIFYQIVKPSQFSDYAMYLLMVFIASNPITKAFFWTVHQQMFNLLTPLLCIYILSRSDQLQKPLSFSQMASVFLLGGFLLLVYGNFILLLPVLVFFYISHRKEIQYYNEPDCRFIAMPGADHFIFRSDRFLDLDIKTAWCCLFQCGNKGLSSINLDTGNTYSNQLKIFFQKLLLNTGYFFQTMQQLLILLIFSAVILLFAKNQSLT